jgi:ribosomal 50S subunit-recycling heat shock protein
MRLDKFLKISRIIKRRTVANDACGEGYVLVNGKIVKPAYDLKIGDEIEVRFGQRVFRCRVKKMPEHAPKNEAAELYEVIEAE